MPMVVVECPHCRCPCSVEDLPIGRVARCPGCGWDSAPPAAEEIARLAADPVSHPDPGPSSGTWPRPAALPEKIGRFLIRERLGAGAFGAVYRALDPNLEREVALKVPHREIQQDPTASERFLREARAAARLNHPHIVPVYEAGTFGETSYLACAYIPGRTLADALDDGPLEPRRAARIVAALADALHAAHREGIVHRDVKPSNILLDVDDQPRLADFGLARLGEGGPRLTQAGIIIGTPAYLAPEQAGRKGHLPEAASDQYSLGATFYELLCGRVPFSGPIEIVIFHTLQTPPPPLREERPDVPVELESICLRALAKRPEDRYPTCRDLAHDLRRWEAAPSSDSLSPAFPAVADRTVSAPAPEGARRRRAPALLGGMIVVALVGSMALWVSSRESRRMATAEVTVRVPSPPAAPTAPPADIAGPGAPLPIPSPAASKSLPDLPSDVFAGPIVLVDRGPRMGDTPAPTSSSDEVSPEAVPAPREPEYNPSVGDLRLVGGFLALKDAEDDVSAGIAHLRKLRDAYETAVVRGKALEKDLAAARQARDPLVKEREGVQRKIDDHLRLVGSALLNDAVVKKAYNALLSQLTRLDDQISKYPAPEEIDQQHRRSREDIDGQHAALAERVSALRATVDRTQRAYARLAADPGVAARIEEARRPNKRVRLGPSPGFLSRVEELETIEKALSGAGSRAMRKPRRR